MLEIYHAVSLKSKAPVRNFNVTCFCQLDTKFFFELFFYEDSGL